MNPYTSLLGLRGENLITNKLEDYLMSLELSSSRKNWDNSKMIREEIEKIKADIKFNARREIETDLEFKYESQIEDLYEDNNRLEEENANLTGINWKLKERLYEIEKSLKSELGKVQEIIKEIL
jgi:predicted RNase H-like nuclease (RuvC/YqgF family)